MQRPTRRLLAAGTAALIAALPLVACGEETDTGSHTTHTTTTGLDETTTSDPTDALSEEDKAVLAEVEERGAPTMEATGPVDELQITDDVVGTGAEVVAGDTVTVHYTGVAATSGEQFDSSWDSGAPATFSLDGVIEGWGEGLVGMKVGGRRTLAIPADLAYGDGGPAPGDSLVFTVDLIAVA